MATRHTDDAMRRLRSQQREDDERARRAYQLDVAAGYIICGIGLLLVAILLFYYANELSKALAQLEGIWQPLQY